MSNGFTNGWHLRREISVGHILMTLTVILAAVGYAVSNEARHTTHQVRIDTVEARIEREAQADRLFRASIRSDIGELRAEIRDGFNRLSDKIDDKQDK